MVLLFFVILCVWVFSFFLNLKKKEDNKYYIGVMRFCININLRMGGQEQHNQY